MFYEKWISIASANPRFSPKKMIPKKIGTVF